MKVNIDDGNVLRRVDFDARSQIAENSRKSPTSVRWTPCTRVALDSAGLAVANSAREK